MTGKKPGGVRVEWKNIDEVVGWIHSAGGQAILAHPFRYRMTNTKIKNMFLNFKEIFGDGVEVVTATSTEEEISLSNNWAEEYELLSSCGSDYHGWANQRIQIGRLRDLPNLDNAIWRYLPCRK